MLVTRYSSKYMNDVPSCTTLVELYFDDALSWFFKTDSLNPPQMKPIWFPARCHCFTLQNTCLAFSPFSPVERIRAAWLCLSYSHLPNILFGFYNLNISHHCQLSPPPRIPQDFPPQDNVFAIKIDSWGMVESNSSISSSHMRRRFQNSTKMFTLY